MMTNAELLNRASVISHGRDAVAAEVDGEIVVLNVRRGFCYGLNRTGTRVWNLAAAPIAISDVCAQLIDEFEIDADQCEADVLELVAGMRDEGLITTMAEPSPPAIE